MSTIGVGDQIEASAFTEDADIRVISPDPHRRRQLRQRLRQQQVGRRGAAARGHDLCGLPVAVFRCDMILADTRYVGQLNVPDMFTRLMLSLVATGIAPGSFYELDADGNRQRAHYDGLPVDFIAEAISTLGAAGGDGFETYHVMNPYDDGIGLDEYVDWLIDAGYPIQRIADYDDWLQRFETAMRALPEQPTPCLAATPAAQLSASREADPRIDGVHRPVPRRRAGRENRPGQGHPARRHRRSSSNTSPTCSCSDCCEFLRSLVIATGRRNIRIGARASPPDRCVSLPMTQRRSRIPGWTPRVASAPTHLFARILRPTSPPLMLAVVVAALLIAAESAVVYLLEQVSPGSIFGVVFLIGVLVVATLWGFGVGMAMAVASAVVYVHFHHLQTGRTVTAIWEQEWVAITVFLVVALGAAGLAGLARSRAAEAVQRRREVEASHGKLSALAEQQAALRRIATLVARGVSPSEVFSAVALELAGVLGVNNAAVWRYEPNGAATLLAAWDAPGAKPMPIGQQLPLDGDNVAAMVRHTGGPARMDDHDHAAGPAAAQIRELGLRGGVGAPVIVDGRLWGVAVVGSSRSAPLPPDTEERVADFADLVATAIANAQAHAELAASRVRIVAAADDARRRIERDLHDGAQQRLVSLGLELRTAQDCVPPELQQLREQIAALVTNVAGVSKDLQDLSRGIHPAILSKGDLARHSRPWRVARPSRSNSISLSTDGYPNPLR